MLAPEEIDSLARIAVDCGYRMHRDLGPGLLESAYEALMFEGIRRKGLSVARQTIIPLSYDGIIVDAAFRADLILEGALLLEIKSVERNAPVHGKQVLTYLRLANLPLGILMDFGMHTFKEGVRRIANGHHESPIIS